MIRLDRTVRKLQVVLGGAVATNQLNVIVTGVERIPSAAAQQAPVIGFTQIATTNNTTDVDICAAPQVVGRVREIESIYVRNGDTAAATLSIKYDDNATDYVLYSATLAVGDFVAYSYQSGWQLFDTNGNTKTTAALVIGATITGGTATRVLFIGAGPVLDDDAELTYNDTTNVLTVNGSTFGTNTQVGGTLGVTGTTTAAGVTCTSLTDSGLTSGRVPRATTGGLLADSANLTFDGTTLTSNALTVSSGTMTVTGTFSTSPAVFNLNDNVWIQFVGQNTLLANAGGSTFLQSAVGQAVIIRDGTPTTTATFSGGNTTFAGHLLRTGTTQDIGASGTGWRTGYFGTSVNIAGGGSLTGGKVFPETDAAAQQSVSGIYAGNGAPNNANGANGDFYFRGDGTQAGNTVIYHREAAAWVALITT